MYAHIKRTPNHGYDIDPCSSDDESDFYEKPLPRVRSDDEKAERRYARHRRYAKNPQLERERNILKRKYHEFRRMIHALNVFYGSDVLAAVVERLQNTVQHPNSVYIYKAIGDRRVHFSIDAAIQEYKHDSIIVAVAERYVECTSPEDCKAFISALEKISVESRQLLAADSTMKMMFILESANVDHIARAKNMLSESLRVPIGDIITVPTADNKSFVVIKSVIGDLDSNNGKLLKLKTYPPKQCGDIAALISMLVAQTSSDGKAPFVMAQPSPEMPYNFSGNAPLIVIQNMTVVNGNITNPSQCFVNSLTAEPNNGNNAATKQFDANAHAEKWIAQNPPDDKEYSSDYFLRYTDLFVDKNKALPIQKFTPIVRASGYKRIKKSSLGGKSIWVRDE